MFDDFGGDNKPEVYVMFQTYFFAILALFALFGTRVCDSAVYVGSGTASYFRGQGNDAMDDFRFQSNEVDDVKESRSIIE